MRSFLLDPVQNPFSPGAGSPPPELVGRENITKQGEILYARVKQRRSEKSLLLTGLRGVGKTVLLNELEQLAVCTDYKTVFIEAHENKSLSEMLVPSLRQLLYRLDRIAGAGYKVRRGLAVLRSFINGIKMKIGEVEVGLDIEPEKGTADSGDLECDLTNLFIAVAEAAEEKNTAIAILIANSPVREIYNQFIATPVIVSIGNFRIDKPLLLWVNDGMMAIYFLLVGLEIKREIKRGILSDRTSIIVPAITALSGLLFPALIFIAINIHNETFLQGWAIPSATWGFYLY